MKTGKIFLTAVFTLAVGPGALNAQERQQSLTVDLFLPAMSPVSRMAGEDMTFLPLNVMYQRMLTDHQVMMLKMGLTYTRGSDGERILDIYPMLALHWHPYSDGLAGFYVGPALFYNYSTYSYSGSATGDDLDHSYWAAVGGNLGYGFELRSNKVIDLIFGLGYGYSKEVDVNGKVTSDHRVDETIGGVFFGYSF